MTYLILALLLLPAAIIVRLVKRRMKIRRIRRNFRSAYQEWRQHACPMARAFCIQWNAALVRHRR